METKKERVFFVMPAYNEEANIENVVRQWIGTVDRITSENTDAWLVIANDGSKDTTWKKMDQLRHKYPRFIPLDKPNSGHGATVMYLYSYAIEQGADYIFQTDSDGQTDPNEFNIFWSNRKLYDMQIGHRSERQDGISRIIVTKVLKWVVRFTFHVNVTDANTPFRLMRTNSVKPVLDLIPQDFFLANVALSAIAVRQGLTCRWLPITFKPRQGGANSINLRRIFRIGWKAVGDFYRINKSLPRKG